MPEADETMPDQVLKWHIPMDDARLTWRLRLLKILIAAMIYIGTLWIFASRALRLPGLAALVPIVAILLFFSWKGSKANRPDDDNIRLSKDGLSWQDPGGGTGQFPREKIRGFRIGLDPDTLRAIPALTLILAGGFESQPVELYEPASPARVRQFMSDELGVAEHSVTDEQFSRQLRRTLETVLASERDAVASLVLRHGLIDPEKNASGSWLVGSVPQCGDIFHDPVRCSYRIVSSTLGDVDASSIRELLLHVRRRAVPVEDSAAHDLVARIRRAETRSEQRALVDDIRAVGVYYESDEHGRWHFEGSRDRLLSLCNSIEHAAHELAPAPRGARRSARQLGGDAMRFKVQVGERAWTDDETICGTREQLVELAGRMRESLTMAQVDTDHPVTAKDGSRQSLVVVLHVKSDGHDPAAQFETLA